MKAKGRKRQILLVHQNFPGQFKHLVPALLRDGRYGVTGFTMNDAQAPASMRLVRYQAAQGTTPGIHPWVAETETKVIRAEAAYQAARALANEGYVPDLILAHPGWGESLFLKNVWPAARLVIYCEFFYDPHGVDIGFDPEFPRVDPADACRVQMKNVNNLLHFEIADGGVSPTNWQKSTFPEPFRESIQVIHDGIDTQVVCPAPGAWLKLGNLHLTREDEVITFVNRNLEPYRGYHIFMRSLPQILQTRRHAHVLIVGGDDVSYGAAAPSGSTWKQRFLDEVRDQIDLNRVHFLGHIEYQHFIPLLQLSTVHVYLTYPFVLSWSLLEAMSAGCAIVASDTAPLQEAITDDETGRLVLFHDPEALAAAVIALLESPKDRQRLGAAAREFARRHYDLETICLPRMLSQIESWMGY